MNLQYVSMIFQEKGHIPINRTHGPLPEESSFVCAARDSIPQARIRVTTANTRGSLRGRGRGRNSSNAGHSEEATRGSGRGKGKGRKRTIGATSSGTANVDDHNRAKGGATRRTTYNRGRGSAHYLLYGDDVQQTGQASHGNDIPDLNAPGLAGEEIPVSQNAPGADHV